MNAQQPLRIPYGVADFVKLRQRGHYFVDKTHYLPLLEQAGEFLFLIRPRRFGESLLQSVMECYYDRYWEPHFDELFHDTWIHAHPTPEKHCYLTLRFDFSVVDADPHKLEESFEGHLRIEMNLLFRRYRTLIPPEVAEQVMGEPTGSRRLERLFSALYDLGLLLYLFIDEYDNFANNLLVREGRQKYQELTHGGGLFRHFFSVYQFHKQCRESVTNSDMALYYLQSLYQLQTPPDELIDHNVRIDYSKLCYLVQIDQTLNGNFNRLRAIIETGEQVSDIQVSFPVEALLQSENFVSLLYYLGLLTFAGEREGAPLLKIPNQTIRKLMYGYLRDAYRDVDVFKPSVWKIGEKLRAMAYRGEWAAFFDYLSEQIQQQASVRDYLQGQKMIQGFLLAWLNLTLYFRVWREQEWGGGFVDLYPAPFYARYRDMRHAYLIELKYLKRGEDSPAQRQKVITEAQAQLARYGQDARVREVLGPATLHPLILVYSGWELVYREEVGATMPATIRPDSAAP